MNTIFKKLNYKTQSEIAVINAPSEFTAVVDEMRTLTTVVKDPYQLKNITFAIAFVMKQEEVNSLSHLLAEELIGDGILWMAYPKGSSKKYRCDFNRNNGWAMLGKLGFEPVRQVAINEDWSALRFRRVEYIKKMTRHKDGALTETGKIKTQPKTS